MASPCLLRDVPRNLFSRWFSTRLLLEGKPRCGRRTRFGGVHGIAAAAFWLQAVARCISFCLIPIVPKFTLILIRNFKVLPDLICSSATPIRSYHPHGLPAIWMPRFVSQQLRLCTTYINSLLVHLSDQLKTLSMVELRFSFSACHPVSCSLRRHHRPVDVSIVESRLSPFACPWLLFRLCQHLQQMSSHNRNPMGKNQHATVRAYIISIYLITLS